MTRNELMCIFVLLLPVLGLRALVLATSEGPCPDPADCRPLASGQNEGYPGAEDGPGGLVASGLAESEPDYALLYSMLQSSGYQMDNQLVTVPSGFLARLLDRVQVQSQIQPYQRSVRTQLKMGNRFGKRDKLRISNRFG